jgi:tetratricopeptide (TPR) repeat protein
MTSKQLRAIAVALVLGTATAAAVVGFTATSAEAAVRASVGKPLQAALADAASGNYSAAMNHIREAESVGGLTGEEQSTISKMKDYIAVKSGGSVGVTDSVGARAKFAADWRARRYSDVVSDTDLLRKYGAMDTQSSVVVAQAYYMMHDYKSCIRITHDSGNSVDVLELQARCSFEIGDNDSLRSAVEQLVASTGKPQYWNQLLKLAETSKGLSDHQTLDIYRIKYLTGAVKGADDYFTLAQLDLQFGFAAEAQSVVQKGMQANILVDSRAQRLMALAKSSYAGDLANLPKTIKAANAAKNGDALVKLGEDYCGMGRFPDAVSAIQAGIAKGVSDPNNAQTRLGQALFGAGQKDAALRAFAKVTSPSNAQMTAHLWSLYVRGH